MGINDREGEHESYLYDESEGLFSKSDRVGVIAALVDATILGIGLVLFLLWQGGATAKHIATPTNYSPGLSSKQIGGSNGAVSAAAVKTAQSTKVRVCEALVTSQSPSGKRSRVEFRGNCGSIRALSSNPNLKVTMLQTRSFTYNTSGG